MSLFAVKNDKGEWLGWEVYQDDPEFICGGGSVWTDLDKAKFYAKANDGHVVELVEAPAKVVVSEAEAEMLKNAKDTTVWRPASVIAGYACDHEQHGDDEALLEDRLMRAYVIGWEVEKPKRYLVRVPYTNRHYYYQKCDSGEVIPVWDMETEPPTQFTDAEIEHYELTDCEKVECENYD